jgi:cytochrome c5
MTLGRMATAVTILLIGLASATGSARAVSPAPGPAMQNGEDLPDGDGKKILQTSCTACHDLTEVTKFKGYYTRDDWRDIVKTMVAYGASVKADDVDVLVDYLTKNLGKK